MNTGTIIYVKKKFLFKERVTFIGMVLNLPNLGTYVYYFKGGRVRKINLTEFQYKNKDYSFHIPIENTNVNRSTVARELTNLLIAKFKYKNLDRFLMWFHEVTHIEFEVPKATYLRNGYIFKGDMIAEVLRKIYPQEYNRSVGVYSKTLIPQ